MLPLLFEIRGWGMPTHEFFIAIGLAVATAVYFWEARRKGLLSEQTAWIAVGALVGGAILAKVGSAWRFAGDGSTLTELYLFGGRSILGGLAGAYVGALITKRLLGYRRLPRKTGGDEPFRLHHEVGEARASGRQAGAQRRDPMGVVVKRRWWWLLVGGVPRRCPRCRGSGV